MLIRLLETDFSQVLGVDCQPMTRIVRRLVLPHVFGQHARTSSGVFGQHTAGVLLVRTPLSARSRVLRSSSLRVVALRGKSEPSGS